MSTRKRIILYICLRYLCIYVLRVISEPATLIVQNLGREFNCKAPSIFNWWEIYTNKQDFQDFSSQCSQSVILGWSWSRPNRLPINCFLTEFNIRAAWDERGHRFPGCAVFFFSSTVVRIVSILFWQLSYPAWLFVNFVQSIRYIYGIERERDSSSWNLPYTTDSYRKTPSIHKRFMLLQRRRQVTWLVEDQAETEF